jgi:hypothetical protein
MELQQFEKNHSESLCTYSKKKMKLFQKFPTLSSHLQTRPKSERRNRRTLLSFEVTKKLSCNKKFKPEKNKQTNKQTNLIRHHSNSAYLLPLAVSSVS